MFSWFDFMKSIDVLSIAVVEIAMHAQQVSWVVSVTHPTILI
jgi:hypothetical protein